MRCSDCSEEIKGTVYTSGTRRICFECLQRESVKFQLRCDSCGERSTSHICAACEVAEPCEVPDDPFVRAVLCNCGEFNVIPAQYVGRYICTSCKHHFEVSLTKGVQ